MFCLCKSRIKIDTMFFRNTTSLYTVFYSGINTNTIRCKSGAVENTIMRKLQTALETTHLDVTNEQSADGGLKEKTLLKLVVVTDKFHGLPMYKRYNLINDILKEELQAGTHMFSIVAKTPIQWHRSLAAQEHSPGSGGAD